MASGDTLAIFLGGEGHQHNDANGALWGYDTIGRPVVRFEDANDKQWAWPYIMPQYYSGGSIDVIVHYHMSAANTTKVVKLDGQFEVLADGADASAFGYAAVQSWADITVPAAAEIVDVQTKQFTQAQADGINAGNYFRFKLVRNADDAGDTAVGFLQVLSIELREA